jgi:glycosyltransferase involved in cell wall biosynthesis
MIIRYDYQIFCKQQFGGISRYFYELIKGLENNPENGTQLDLLFSDNRYYQSLHNNTSLWNNLHFKGKKDFTYFFASCYDAYQLRHKTFDVFHPTYYNKTSLERTKGKPMVVTIHDLIDEKFHQNNPAFSGLIEARKAHIAQAHKIIAVSENTKKDLVELCQVAPEKIEVIYHGNSFTNSVLRYSLEPIVQNPYLLYLGRRDGYKNFIPFVKAVKAILQENKALQIICAGGGRFTKEESTLFETLGIGSQLKYLPIKTDATLASLYNNALLFIYPSLYEGFGFPIIESFQCGCPVITANCSSTIEIGVTAATYFDPSDEASIKHSIHQMLYNKKEQEKMVQLGYQRAKDFSWEKTVAKTLELYHSL